MRSVDAAMYRALALAMVLVLTPLAVLIFLGTALASGDWAMAALVTGGGFAATAVIVGWIFLVVWWVTK